MLVPRKHIIWSLAFHLGLIFLLNFIGSLNQSIKKTFIVFGIHSRNPSFVSYKAIPKGTPFIGNKVKKNCITSVKKHPARIKQVSKKLAQKTIQKVKPLAPRQRAKTTQRLSISKKKPAIKIVKPKKKNLVKPKKSLVKKKRSTTFQKSKNAKQIVSPRKPEALKVSPKKALPKTEPKTKDRTDLIKKEVQNEMGSKDEVDKNETIDFNLIGYCSDKELLVYQRHIQREVERLWRPPLGVPKGTLCTVLFSLNSHGQVKNCKFMERSNVLIYDLSIMQVAKRFAFNKCLWGKQFKIDFRQ